MGSIQQISTVVLRSSLKYEEMSIFFKFSLVVSPLHVINIWYPKNVNITQQKKSNKIQIMQYITMAISRSIKILYLYLNTLRDHLWFWILQNCKNINTKGWKYTWA